MTFEIKISFSLRKPGLVKELCTPKQKDSLESWCESSGRDETLARRMAEHPREVQSLYSSFAIDTDVEYETGSCEEEAA